MRAWACLPIACALACGSKTTASSVTFYLDPPMSDASCLGVVGFDVEINSSKRAAQSIQLLMGSPVLGTGQCHLPRPFSVDELDVNAAATVTVTGYDGNKTPLVQATQTIDDLMGGPVHLQLAPTNTSPGAIFVVNRGSFSNGTMLADLTGMTITNMKGKPVTILNVTRATAVPYFDADPGAYWVQSTELQPGGASNMAQLLIDFTASTSTTIPRAKVVAAWIGTYYQAQ